MTEEHEEEIEVIDVSLDEHEIDEVIAHLMDLKEHKESVQIPIASDLDLSVTYDSDSENSQDVVSEGDDDPDGDDGDDSSGNGDDGTQEAGEKVEEAA